MAARHASMSFAYGRTVSVRVTSHEKRNARVDKTSQTNGRADGDAERQQMRLYGERCVLSSA